MKRDERSKMAEAVACCSAPSPSSLLPHAPVFQAWMLTPRCVTYTAELGRLLPHGRRWKTTAFALFQVAQQPSFDVPDSFLQARTDTELRLLWAGGWVYVLFVF